MSKRNKILIGIICILIIGIIIVGCIYFFSKGNSTNNARHEGNDWIIASQEFRLFNV